MLVSPLLVVPTDLTENTEAYGLKLLESTEKPTLREAGTHGNEGLFSVVLHSYVLYVAEAATPHRSL